MVLKGKGYCFLIVSPSLQIGKKSTENQFLKRLTAGYLYHPPLLKDFRTEMFPQYDILIFSMQMD